MASPYILTNSDLQYINSPGQDFNIYLAFLNPVAITTTWNDLNMDANGNWLPPPNVDTANRKIQPYAPTANLGSNRVGFVGEQLYVDGGRSAQRFDLPIVAGSYTWTVTGPATITYYNNSSQIGVVWSSPGLYSITLAVKDRAGTTTTGTRQVQIYQDRASAIPGLISVTGLSGSLASGGWQFQCTTVNSQVSLFNPDALFPGTYQPVIVYCETRYEIEPGVWINRTMGPHAMFNPGAPYIDPRILFDGYIQSGTVHQDIDKDTLSFSCVGPQLILQEAKTHQLGYYNCAYTSVINNIPQGCVASPAGAGFQVGQLMSSDVIHSLLQTHSNIGNYHDIHCWNACIPVNAYNMNNAQPVYNMVYTTLSVNEGTIWQNMADLASNEYAQVWCEHDGSIRVGPQVNYRGNDFWNIPTMLGPNIAPFLLNYMTDLGFSVSVSPGTPFNTANFPTLPSQPFPVEFVHPWGHQLNPPQHLAPLQGAPNTQIVQTQQSLMGAPILCVFSDTPIYDSSSVPPDTSGILFPWITMNWPQDLAIYPLSIDLQENYTGRASLCKLIGTLYGNNTLWSSWYPQNTFQLQGNGTVSVVTTTLPASDWVVNESHVLPDVTSSQNAQLVWNYWWEMARREYYARNINYNGTITVGMFTAATLGDIVAITRQNTTLGPKFNTKLFYVNEVSYSLDLTSRTWQTSLTIAEVTSVNIGHIVAPPTSVPPKG